jgi:short-subunit dehydrogenase
MSFQNKVALITGASSGIGEELAYALHQRGAKLILSSRREAALQKVKEKCAGDVSDIHILPLDLIESGTLNEKAQQAISIYGHIDYLFNNGGISQRSIALNTKEEVLRKVMDINFFGTVALTKAILPSMIERKSGHIVVTSSVMGKFGTRLRSSYAASKHALQGYFDSLRQEVNQYNIKVSLVCPGFIKTDITKNMLEASGAKYGKMSDGQKHGMETDKFVEKLLPKIENGENEIYIGGREIYGVYLKRYVPDLFYKILEKVDVT